MSICNPEECFCTTEDADNNQHCIQPHALEERANIDMALTDPTTFPNLDTAEVKPRQSPLTQLVAVSEVLNTTELLEQILLHLPLQQLLVVAQLVNTRFRDTIRHSIKLQRALFLAPVSGSDPHQETLLNPFFESKILGANRTSFEVPGGTFIIVVISTDRWCYDNGRHQNIGKENPTILLPGEGNDIAVRIDMRRYSLVPSHWSILERRSWENMYLTQPPCPVEVKLYEQESKFLGVLRFGELLESLVEVIRLRRCRSGVAKFWTT